MQSTTPRKKPAARKSVPAKSVSPAEVLEVAVIGTGFSGLGMGIRLKKAGITNFKIFEKASEVGGTWRDNTYPGCACDVKSALYSYSFEPSAEWSNAYANQGEIFSYIRFCAEKYGMYPHIQFNSKVVSGKFDEAAGEWVLTLDGGEIVRAKNVVAAPGPFAEPSVAKIDGINDFKGIKIHTARWDHSVDLTGKRVALIGTGATGVQVGPAIAPKVAHLTVFQRTPNWIMPRPNRDRTDAEKKDSRENPLKMRVDRLKNYWINEATAPFLILKYDAFKSFPAKMSHSYLERKVKDPVLREKLTPKYKFGCKRVLVSSDWYPTLQRDNVTLEDHGIKRITETGIETVDGKHYELDVIIFATGYEVRSTGAPFEVRGLNNESLGERWKDGAEAFDGITTHGFPNLYFLVGPFTGPGHTSVIAYSEAQIDYVWQAIELRRARQLKYITVKSEVEAEFVKIMDQRSEHTVWKSGCASWYLSPNGRNNTLYPGFNAEYRMRILRFNPSSYILVGQDGQPVKATFKDHLSTARMALTA
ncbi:flavin-containing monooxygenase [Aquirhabdus sp.]|uniref:flavin-containing monooxygenase n=1 Tax=Aquirhabdus sp. TaxID=2824160 RepID=UPI00396C6604